MNQCYNCGKAIQDEDLVVKKVSLGEFRSERKPFHKECWTMYHARETKKSALQYGALAIVIFLWVGVAPIYLIINTTLGLILLALSIALLVSLGIMYFRIEK